MSDKNLWEKTVEVSSDAWEATKDGASKAWEKTKEWSGDAWEATKDGGEYLADKTGDAWEATKDAVSSKSDDKHIEVRRHADNSHNHPHKFD